jgi:hypothetical protein
VSWWNALAFAHRWLGIAGGLLFIVWFSSGVAMMYVRMPEVTVDERLARSAAIDPSTIHVTPGDAAQVAGVSSSASVQLTMLGARPVYRFSGRTPTTVFADRAERHTTPSPEDAIAVARTFVPRHAASLRYDQLIDVADQWTLQSRADLPLHRVLVGDDEGTELYVSSRTGEVVMETTRKERLLAYVGPVAHWLYLPVLRRNGPLWSQVIIWLSAAGCGLCLSGLLAGLLRFSPFRRFTLKSRSVMSPYSGWMKWHHYAGLLFGVITLSWTFSGLLSMGPFPPLLASEGVTSEQRRALTGAPAPLDRITLQALRDAVAVASRSLAPKELTLTTFRSEPYWLVVEGTRRRGLVSAVLPHDGVFPRFTNQQIEEAARNAMPGHRIVDAMWLEEYDAYYYDRAAIRPLPVLRVRYDDSKATWIYFDPSRGAIGLVVAEPDRRNRWLYHGLHSLDFPFLYNRRPAWDIVVIALSLGGVVGAATSLIPAWRRLGHHATRLGRNLSRSRRDANV